MTDDLKSELPHPKNGKELATKEPTHKSDLAVIKYDTSILFQ